VFAVTSGRPPRGVQMLIKSLELDTPIAAFNGGLVVDSEMSVIDQKVIHEELVPAIVAMIGSSGLDVWLYQGADWLVRDPDAPHVARESFTVQFDPTVVENLDGITEGVAKIVGVSDDHERVASVAKPRTTSSKTMSPRLVPSRTTWTSPTRRRTRAGWSSFSRPGTASRGADRHDRLHAERRVDVRALGSVDRDGPERP
jgi:hydroxymethylpyrimidine pyrophosphatase-like HAD family hydrolase